MLREITALRSNRSNSRRWYTDADMDLYIWFVNQMPVRFQLTYNKKHEQQAVYWDNNDGFLHSRIQQDNRLDGKCYVSLTFLDQHEYDAVSVARNFLIGSECLDPTLADFIYARLLECPTNCMLNADPVPVAANA